MERLSPEHLRLRAFAGRVGDLDPGLRSPETEYDLDQLGARLVGIERADPPEPDLGEAPPEASALSVAVRPVIPASQVFDAPPMSAALVYATPGADGFFALERNEFGVWLSVNTVLSDGCVVRTLRRPERFPPGYDPMHEDEDLFPPAWLPGITELRIAMAGSKFEATFADRPAAGVRQQLVDGGGAAALLEAHRAFALKGMGHAEVPPHDTMDLYLPMARRLLHVSSAQDDDLDRVALRVGIALLAPFVAVLTAVLVAGGVGVPMAVWLAFLLSQVGRNTWRLICRRGGVGSVVLWLALFLVSARDVAVAPFAPGLAFGTAFLGAAIVGLAFEAVPGVLSPRLLREMSEPAPVPLDAMPAAYCE